MEKTDEFATNYHNYDTLDKIYMSLEQSIAQLEHLKGTLHRDIVRGQNELVISRAKELLPYVWQLRRYCDQHAG